MATLELRFPEGHEHAGQVIGRKGQCAECRCDLPQFEVNPEYLLDRPYARQAYLKTCAVTESGRVYQPRECPPCARRQIIAPIHTLPKERDEDQVD